MAELTYATVEDMVEMFSEQELIELTDHVNIPQTTIERPRVERALSDAVAEINGYVGMVYKLPLFGCKKVQLPGQPAEYEAPPKLRKIACDLARFYLYDDLAPEHEVFRRYEIAKADLKEIAAGKAMLACPLGGSPGEVISTDPVNIGGETSYTFSPRKITEDTVKDYK